MKTKYFDEEESAYVLKVVESNPEEAKKRMEDYLDKYPQDYYLKTYYVMLLTRLCLFKKAREVYDKIIRDTSNGNFHIQSTKRLDAFKFNLIMAQIKLLSAEEKYKELLTFIEINKDNIHASDYHAVNKYCKCKLGLMSKYIVEKLNLSYRYRQMWQYSEDAFFEHVKRHEADFMDEHERDTIFASDFPIEEIVKEIKKKLPTYQKYFPGIFDDAYYFKFDNCGRVNNSPVNYFYVVCYHNTNHFITMYPIADARFLKPADLNYLRKVDDSKDNRLSQIEKFNRRFGR